MTAPAAPAAAQTDALPDLRMRQITKFHIERSTDGRRLLRFPTVIVNTGAGPFEVRGRRPGTGAATMTTRQRIYDGAGRHRSIPTDAVMYFAGDGHAHWHVRNLERFRLFRLGGARVGTGAKHGFCFYDNTRYDLALPGAPGRPRYTGCGGPNSLRVRMGLSVGWGDTYPATLRDQYVDITGLPRGRYRLTARADAADWFRESRDRNNHAVTVLRITRTDVTVIRVEAGA